MNDNVLAGLLVGLFIGGVMGALGIAVIATGSKQRLPPAMARGARAAATEIPAEQTRPDPSMRVDLLHDLRESPPGAELLVAEADDIDQEMRELVRRYGEADGSEGDDPTLGPFLRP